MKALQRMALRLALSAAALAATGCASITPVRPWEKGILAKPEMTFEGDTLDLMFTEHILASREGAAGGTGAGGGGCGCY
ncbi:MAG: DUF4266 domain-containing protein [Betaproteobacteria bacterium]|nr:DUF4266 domain-containing protein [Betaproteobacteria bacterium]